MLERVLASGREKKLCLTQRTPRVAMTRGEKRDKAVLGDLGVLERVLTSGREEKLCLMQGTPRVATTKRREKGQGCAWRA